MIGIFTWKQKNTLTGIVDVAMVGSMYSKGKISRYVKFIWNGNYG